MFKVSQSLVNEGRFPQEVKVEVKEREVKSQSLVNEGRFPLVFVKGSGIRDKIGSQSLVNEGRFPHVGSLKREARGS